jgi:hypothetical protein
MTHGRRRALLSLAALPFASTFAPALKAQPGAPAEVTEALRSPRLQGSGTLRFLGLRIYDARLWVAERAVADDWVALPLALELAYQRALEGEQIAERSLVEMRRQGEIAAEPAARWLAAMKKLFPDVKAGDRITGVNLPGEGARFFVNGTLRGELKEAEFARLFFGIWLSPKTSEPALRQALLGTAR